MNEHRAKLAAPLIGEAKVLKKQITGRWAWLAAHVKHPEFEQRLRELHAMELRMQILRKRITNIASGRPQWGQPEGTWTDPTPRNNHTIS